MTTFAAAFEWNANKVDPLAQSVEHNTFNVGVLGSSPKRITKKIRKKLNINDLRISVSSNAPHLHHKDYT